MPSRLRSGSCGPSAARGATDNSYFLGSFGKLLSPPTTPPRSAGCVTSEACCRVKARGSRDRKCVIARELTTTPPSCEPPRRQQSGKCVKMVRFETVQDDNRANEQIAADSLNASGMEVAEPLYATVRKRNSPSEHPPQPLQRQIGNMPAGREEGFRPYRSLRHSNCSQTSVGGRQETRHHDSNGQQQHHQHTWHVRQNTEIWSSGYKVYMQ